MSGENYSGRGVMDFETCWKAVVAGNPALKDGGDVTVTTADLRKLLKFVHEQGRKSVAWSPSFFEAIFGR